MKWIKDEDFIRGKTPMTKFNIRALTIAYLNISKGDIFLDIGAGTGSISIEASLQGAKTYSIEKEADAIELIRENDKKFDTGLNIIKGQAPDDLPDIKFNKCFIGGSGGSLEGIFEYLEKHLETGGILCANFIRLNNLSEILELLKKYDYKSVEVQLIQSAHMDSIGLLKGQNPIYIVKGVK